MRVGIIDADLLYRPRQRFPNLACMKISGFYKREGHRTELIQQLNGTLHSDLIQKNGGPKNGFTYVQGNGPIGITLYAENAYEFYQNGASIDQIAKGMFNTMKEYSMDQDAEINIEEMFKPENIIPALVPSEGNEELLKTIPHIPFENLEIIFKFSLPNFITSRNQLR